MRRRKKPVANNSESTGKIGHEIPQGQPTPLQPSYPQPLEPESRAHTSTHASVPAAEPVPAVHAQQEPRRDTGGRGPRQGDGRRGPSGGRGQQGSSRPAQPPREHPAAHDTPALVHDSPALVHDSPALVHETQPDSLSQPPAQLEAAKSPKGYVVLTIGLPGSGKTTWFKRRGVTPLSSDMLRGILFDDITEQRYQGLVFSTLRSLLRARLIAKMPWNYVDATNLSPHERRQWIKMARSFGYEVQAVFFDVPFEVCMERNKRRDYMVNEEAMRKMQERLRPPSFQEGFHKITVVRVKNSGAEESAPAQ